MSDEVKLNDQELDGVQGGYGSWQRYAKGRYDNYGSYIIYHVASGDVLSGIAIRFGVTVGEIQQWNNIANPDRINIGQRLTIYPRTLR